MQFRANSARLWSLLGLLLCDIIGIIGGFAGSYTLLYSSEILNEFSPPTWEQAGSFLTLLMMACAAIFAINRLYAIKRGASRIDEAYTVFVALGIATLVASVIAALVGLRFTTWNLIAAWLNATALVVLLRNIHRSIVYALRKRGMDRARILVVGSGPTGRMIAQTMIRQQHLGYDVQGFLSDTEAVGMQHDGVPVLGRVRDIRRVVRACEVSEVLVAQSGVDDATILGLVAEVEDLPVAIKIYPDAFQIITNNEVSLGDLGGLPLMSVKSSPLDRGFNRALKRGLDLGGALFGLIFLSPVLLAIALAVKLELARSGVFRSGARRRQRRAVPDDQVPLDAHQRRSPRPLDHRRRPAKNAARRLHPPLFVGRAAAADQCVSRRYEPGRTAAGAAVFCRAVSRPDTALYAPA